MSALLLLRPFSSRRKRPPSPAPPHATGSRCRKSACPVRPCGGLPPSIPPRRAGGTPRGSRCVVLVVQDVGAVVRGEAEQYGLLNGPFLLSGLPRHRAEGELVAPVVSVRSEKIDVVGAALRGLVAGLVPPGESGPILPQPIALSCSYPQPLSKLLTIKKSEQANLLRPGGGGWIRTTEAKRNRFTVCPLWPLGNSSRLSCRCRPSGGPNSKPSEAGSNWKGDTAKGTSFRACTEASDPELVSMWSWWTDSNPRPADYKSAALPAELHQHIAAVHQQRTLL